MSMELSRRDFPSACSVAACAVSLGRARIKAFLFSVLCLLALATLGVSAIADEPGPPTLPIGASAPDFCLPGIDGETHCLKDYAASSWPLIIVNAVWC